MIVTVQKINEVFIRVQSERSVEMEISECFTFDIPNAHYMPSFRLQATSEPTIDGLQRSAVRVWDGKKRLYHLGTKLLYSGLLHHLEEFCKGRNYEIQYLSSFGHQEFSVIEARKFISTLNIPAKFEEREYQMDANVKAVRQRRALILSPTSSGKSLMIYIICRLYNQITGKNALIIVPNKGLIGQMTTDFQEYGYKDKIHNIQYGASKSDLTPIVVSTWQSIHRMPAKWFDQFATIVVDEAHGASAKALTNVLQKATNVKYRFGFTGTLDGTTTHKLVLEGLFGPVINTITTAELIDKGYAAPLEIKVLVLKHQDAVRKVKRTYPEEIAFLTEDPHRNKFIKNLALSLKGNTIVLFHREKHGKLLHEMIAAERKNAYLVYGDVEGDERNDIRALMEKNNDIITTASFGTFGVGTSINNVYNLIFAHPFKAQIKNLQAIGRSLRLKDDKTAVLHDIADDLSWQTKKNSTLKHLHVRLGIYADQLFPYKIYNIEF